MVTNKDILKHYLSSLLVYGLTLLIIAVCPLLSENIKHPVLNHVVFFAGYYLLYAILAYPILLKIRPDSVVNSWSVTIVKYFKDLFKTKKIELNDEEKQSFTVLFIKVFFGCLTVGTLCSDYFQSLVYDYKFLVKFGGILLDYVSRGDFLYGLNQYIQDTLDMWLVLTTMLSLIIYAFSYLTEGSFFKNKIKYADTSLLGLISCLCCYPPLVLITYKIVPTMTQEMLEVNNSTLRTVIGLLIIFSNIFEIICLFSLGGKAGNLTNRGIVTRFPYNITRHPIYFMEISKLILYHIAICCVPQVTIIGKIVFTIGLFIWIGIYITRSIAEERLLSKDEEYVTYMQKVKYRFIPKIF